MTLKELSSRLYSLAVFRGLLRDPVMEALARCVRDCADLSNWDALGSYGEFVSRLYRAGGDLGLHIQRAVEQDENVCIRAAGRGEALPEYLVSRQPFPGPGLAIRVIGDVTREKLDILREADAIFREEIARAGEEQNLSQYFAALTNMRSVGVMGDGRTYDYAVALRGVTTSDFMTADWARLPYEVLEAASVRIVNEVKGVNRVLYDVTSKPPATVEWE